MEPRKNYRNNIITFESFDLMPEYGVKVNYKVVPRRAGDVEQVYQTVLKQMKAVKPSLNKSAKCVELADIIS